MKIILLALLLIASYTSFSQINTKVLGGKPYSLCDTIAQLPELPFTQSGKAIFAFPSCHIATLPTYVDTFYNNITKDSLIGIKNGVQFAVPFPTDSSTWYNSATNKPSDDVNNNIYHLGNVMVGSTTTATEKLEVNGNISLTGGPSPIIRKSSGSPNAGSLDFGDGTGWKFNFRRRSDATNFVTITDGGNVGIGTANPANRLDIGSALVANTGGITMPITSASPPQIGQAIGVNTNGDIVRIAGLQWSDTSTTPVGIATQDDLTKKWGLLGNAGTNPTTNFIGTTDAQDFVTRANNTEVMRVTQTQRIGVLTTLPTRQFHVAGTARFDAAIYDNRDNAIIQQSLTGVATNRDLTLLNGTYGRLLIHSKELQFNPQATFTANGARWLNLDGGNNTASGPQNGTDAFIKGQNASVSSINQSGGDVYITGGNGVGTGAVGVRHGNVLIGGTPITDIALATSDLSVKGSVSFTNNTITTANPTLTEDHHIVILEAGASGTITLPITNQRNRNYIIVNHSGVNITSSQAIQTGNGVTTTTIPNGSSYQIIYTGTKWVRTN